MNILRLLKEVAHRFMSEKIDDIVAMNVDGSIYRPPMNGVGAIF